MVIVKFFATLRHVTNINEIAIDHEGSIGDILKALISWKKDLKKAICDERGNLVIIILLNGRDIDYLKGLGTIVEHNDTIHLFPPIAGG